ncbi:hypothetical protein PXNS11_420046 [Stutzerimonas xanthomarina]|nr:hypothetical protein PXNS11_420046 [Stutzerimonas xanthomarina]
MSVETTDLRGLWPLFFAQGFRRKIVMHEIRIVCGKADRIAFDWPQMNRKVQSDGHTPNRSISICQPWGRALPVGRRGHGRDDCRYGQPAPCLKYGQCQSH